MAELLLKDVSEETVRRLERRAEAHGRSVEAEHKAIVEEALGGGQAPAEPMTMAEWIDAWQNSPLAEVDDEIWQSIRDREDTGRAAYVSPEGLERLVEVLRRRQ